MTRFHEYHPHVSRDALDRIVAKFGSSHMSDAKWVKLLNALSTPSGLVKSCRVKLVWETADRAFRLDEHSTFRFDYWDHAVESMVAGIQDGWVAYRELEWIEFPPEALEWVDQHNRAAGRRTVSQDLERIQRTIEQTGKFELSRSADGLRLIAYR